MVIWSHCESFTSNRSNKMLDGADLLNYTLHLNNAIHQGSGWSFTIGARAALVMSLGRVWAGYYETWRHQTKSITWTSDGALEWSMFLCLHILMESTSHQLDESWMTACGSCPKYLWKIRREIGRQCREQSEHSQGISWKDISGKLIQIWCIVAYDGVTTAYNVYIYKYYVHISRCLLIHTNRIK